MISEADADSPRQAMIPLITTLSCVSPRRDQAQAMLVWMPSILDYNGSKPTSPKGVVTRMQATAGSHGGIS